MNGYQMTEKSETETDSGDAARLWQVVNESRAREMKFKELVRAEWNLQQSLQRELFSLLRPKTLESSFFAEIGQNRVHVSELEGMVVVTDCGSAADLSDQTTF